MILRTWTTEEAWDLVVEQNRLDATREKRQLTRGEPLRGFTVPTVSDADLCAAHSQLDQLIEDSQCI